MNPTLRIAAATLGAALAATVATPALAANPTTTVEDCLPNDHIEILSSRSNFMPADGNYFKAGPGGTMTVTSQTASTISASISAGAEIGVEGIVASAKIKVDASITTSVTVTTGQQYSHPVSPGRYGNIQYGTYGFDVDWQKVRVFSNCTYRVLAAGTAKVPTRAFGWNYWESS